MLFACGVSFVQPPDVIRCSSDDEGVSSSSFSISCSSFDSARRSPPFRPSLYYHATSVLISCSTSSTRRVSSFLLSFLLPLLPFYYYLFLLRLLRPLSVYYEHDNFALISPRRAAIFDTEFCLSSVQTVGRPMISSSSGESATLSKWLRISNCPDSPSRNSLPIPATAKPILVIILINYVGVPFFFRSVKRLLLQSLVFPLPSRSVLSCPVPCLHLKY